MVKAEVNLSHQYHQLYWLFGLVYRHESGNSAFGKNAGAGGSVVYATDFGMFFFKEKLKKQDYLGLGLIVLAAILVMWA